MHNLINGEILVDPVEHEVCDLDNDEVNQEAEFLSTAESSEQWTALRNSLAIQINASLVYLINLRHWSM